MKLHDYRQDYYYFSGKASDVARTLALSGIAIIWIFTNQGAGTYRVPRELLWPALFLVATLAFDLLQYVVSALIWGSYSRHLEKRYVPADRELDAPHWFNWPNLFFFWSKLVAVGIAYGFLLQYLWVRLLAAAK